jgi:ribosomal protein L37E
MPACPNCGRPTLRTRDWACQWCGYPLLSKSYKKIDKTYKELQEERLTVSEESTPEPAPQPEAIVKPPPPPKPKKQVTPKTEIQPPPEPAPAPEAAEKPPPSSEPEVPSPPEPESKSKPEPAPAPEAGPQPESKTESVLVTPPPEVTPTPQLAEGPPVSEPPPEPAPAPIALPDLNAITDGAALTVDELDALYKDNRLAAHAKLTNKTIRIKGFVEKVFIRDHIDVRYVVLTGVHKKVVWPVRCTFNKENISPMSRLTAGQEVTLLGKYDSYGKNIIFKECVLA